MALTPRRLLAPTLALCALALVAASAPPAQDDALSLHDLMMSIKRDFKTLSRSVDDPAQADKALDALHSMQGYTLASKLLEPTNLDEVARDERAAHKAAYRADVARMLAALAECEIAVLEGESARAKELFGTLIDLRNASHEAYQGDE